MLKELAFLVPAWDIFFLIVIFSVFVRYNFSDNDNDKSEALSAGSGRNLGGPVSTKH